MSSDISAQVELRMDSMKHIQGHPGSLLSGLPRANYELSSTAQETARGIKPEEVS